MINPTVSTFPLDTPAPRPNYLKAVLLITIATVAAIAFLTLTAITVTGIVISGMMFSIGLVDSGLLTLWGSVVPAILAALALYKCYEWSKEAHYTLNPY